jgi:hypothetical protein
VGVGYLGMVWRSYREFERVSVGVPMNDPILVR